MTKIVGRLMSPTPMSAREAMAVALAINQSNFSPPMSEEELRKIVKSISKRQAISKEAIEREVWAIAKKFGCSYEEATTIWEDHDG